MTGERGRGPDPLLERCGDDTDHARCGERWPTMTDSIAGVVDLVKTYALQETIGPLKGAGRWLGNAPPAPCSSAPASRCCCRACCGYPDRVDERGDRFLVVDLLPRRAPRGCGRVRQRLWRISATPSRLARQPEQGAEVMAKNDDAPHVTRRPRTALPRPAGRLKGRSTTASSVLTVAGVGVVLLVLSCSCSVGAAGRGRRPSSRSGGSDWIPTARSLPPGRCCASGRRCSEAHPGQGGQPRRRRRDRRRR